MLMIGAALRHGTGHGVGHFLNVHEGPHGSLRLHDALNLRRLT
jgi:Xaa-Pro aminopeptidase